MPPAADCSELHRSGVAAPFTYDLKVDGPNVPRKPVKCLEDGWTTVIERGPTADPVNDASRN